MNHHQLAQLSEKSHRKAAEYLRTHPPENALTAGRLGRLHTETLQNLEAEIRGIDAFVE